ncbi:hypothetical protein WJX72_006832 [[Myrmecia] bisecta]|uniref:UGP3-like C-terminal hexapeptide repeats domain-containing protein n=1 Tax=[Myrmecia] bisecta TaxID=41462 RepID=A0AAW1QR48_9CHLO
MQQSSREIQQLQQIDEFDRQLAHLTRLLDALSQATSTSQQVAVLEQDERVQAWLRSARSQAVVSELRCLSLSELFAILCLPAMMQEHVLSAQPEGNNLSLAVRTLSDALSRVNTFYSSIGGLLGYQRKCLEIMRAAVLAELQGCDASEACTPVTFHMPKGPDLAGPDGRRLAAQAAATGLEALPHMAEIYPLGGAGDRLGLKCEVTGASIPTAMLPYCGRTLLEGLIRDLQAREYLYYQLKGFQQMTPIAIMTSDAKGNHQRVLQLLESYNWFGRGQDAFRVFRQPLVPVVSAEDGRWLLPEAMQPVMKPGGHGAIWKLMLDEGVFDWLYQHDREAAIIRQISNPMAGTDATLLALSGAGYADGRSFGFASCERAVGAAEGMNVLMERQIPRPDGRGVEYAYNVTNVEYTEFERLGICDECAEGSQFSRFPANTNVLYVGLKAAEGAVRAGVRDGGGAALPGMIFNLKKKVTYQDAVSGRERTVHAGRMECTMQNLVDSLAQRFRAPVPDERHSVLNTFVVYNKRRRVTSSAKRKRAPGSTSIHQTPDGSFRDLMLNARDLLQRCNLLHVPEVGTVEQYLAKGPGFIFLYHPALGPLWDVIAQKIWGGALADGAEVVLEVAEACLVDVQVEGSLQVRADAVVGQVEPALAVNYNQIVSRRDIQISQINGRQIWYRNGTNSHHPVSATQDSANPQLPLHKEFSHVTGTASAEEPSPVSAKSTSLHSEAVTSGSERLVYSSRCGRIRLNSVIVRNRGIDWAHPGNVYWQHKVQRHETCSIVLHGQAEFEASRVILEGNLHFEVPDGFRMVVTADGGRLQTSLLPIGGQPSWEWRYKMGSQGDIKLTREEAGHSSSPLARSDSTELPFSYVI